MTQITVSARVKDGNGHVAPVTAYASAPAGVALNALGPYLVAWVALINGLTDGVITEASYSVGLDISGITPNDPAGSDINRVLGVRFPLTGVPKTWSLVVPARAAAVVSGGKPVMTEDGTIDTLADLMEVNWVGTGLTAGFFANQDFIQLAPIADGFLSDRKRRGVVAGSRAKGV